MQTSNLVYTHPGQDQMQVEVILASKGMGDHKPIYTIRMRYPRPIHGEIMTHRVFGRNARSSRAVPVKTMLNEVRTIPYVPWHWGKNQRGMQADEECNEPLILNPEDEVTFDGVKLTTSRENAWLYARDVAADTAEAYMEAGYHKQNPNRLLEPFSWIDTLITSTDWVNFLWLRQHGDAEPHLQDLANLVAKAIEEAEVQDLDYGEWHQPYVTDKDMMWSMTDDPLIMDLGCDPEEVCNILSAARCARISYKPFDGDASYEKEFDRYNQLVTSERVHASPLEHQAKPDHLIDAEINLGWENSKPVIAWQNPELHGNLDGYIQARKLVENEAKMD